jgi:hypothetical protein
MRTIVRRLAAALVVILLVSGAALAVYAAGLALFGAGRGPTAFEESRQGAADCGRERLDPHFVSRGLDREARSCFYRSSLAGQRATFESRQDDEATYWVVTREGNVDVWLQNSYAPWVHLEDCRLRRDRDSVFTYAGTERYFFGGGEAGNAACRHEWAYEGVGPPTEVEWQACWAGFVPTTCPVRVNRD